MYVNIYLHVSKEISIAEELGSDKVQKFAKIYRMVRGEHEAEEKTRKMMKNLI